MKNLLTKLHDQQFVRYVIIGVITQVIDWSTYSGLVLLGMHYVLADIVNNPLSLGFNYLGHKYFTFKSHPWSNKEVGRYVLILIVNFFIATAILVAAKELTGSALLAKPAQMVAMVLVNYQNLKRLVFKASGKE